MVLFFVQRTGKIYPMELDKLLKNELNIAILIHSGHILDDSPVDFQQKSPRMEGSDQSRVFQYLVHRNL